MTARIVVVTGTGTGVGKTLVTAALAVTSGLTGSVAVVKPVQTGVGPEHPDELSDTAVVAALAGCETFELARLPDPLAPDTAARLRGVDLPTVAEHAAHIRAIAERHETVLVEGAGGALVRLDLAGATVLDLAGLLDAQVVVVTDPGLGTLNHTELTVGALRARDLEPVGLVLGSWPEAPGLAERCNRTDLQAHTGVALLGALPAGAGVMTPSGFRAAAADWFDAGWLDDLT